MRRPLHLSRLVAGTGGCPSAALAPQLSCARAKEHRLEGLGLNSPQRPGTVSISHATEQSHGVQTEPQSRNPEPQCPATEPWGQTHRTMGGGRATELWGVRATEPWGRATEPWSRATESSHRTIKQSHRTMESSHRTMEKRHRTMESSHRIMEQSKNHGVQPENHGAVRTMESIYRTMVQSHRTMGVEPENHRAKP